jgi:thiamine monophosphate synthase
VIAIGGINHGKAAEVMRAGASGVATIGAIFDADDPRRAAGELRSAISRTTAKR